MIKILDKKSKNFADLRNIILSCRNNSFRFADAVIEYGMKLIRKHKSALGDECKYFFLIIQTDFNIF